MNVPEQSMGIFWLAAALLSCAVLGCGVEVPGLPRRNPQNYWSDPKSIALAKAIDRGDLAEIDKLVAAGADVNAMGKEDISPLVWAIARQQKAAFERLLKHGADPAVRYLHYGSVVHLVAGVEKDSDWLRMVLEHKADPNLDPFHDETPLYAAIYSRNRKNIELLVKAGADIDHGDATGVTPLIYAAARNWFDTVYYLLEAGADYRRREKNGLDVCYEIIDTTVSPKFEAYEWREKVIDWLREKGVSFEEAEEQLRDRERRANPTNAAIFNRMLQRWHHEEEARKARRSH